MYIYIYIYRVKSDPRLSLTQSPFLQAANSDGYDMVAPSGIGSPSLFSLPPSRSLARALSLSRSLACSCSLALSHTHNTHHTLICFTPVYSHTNPRVNPGVRVSSHSSLASCRLPTRTATAWWLPRASALCLKFLLSVTYLVYPSYSHAIGLTLTRLRNRN